jgi:anti-sigma factor RsiW
MSEHEILNERLDDYADGLLDAPEAERVEAHLRLCEDCRHEVAAIRELRAAVRVLPRGIAPPRDLWGGIAERIAEAQREEPEPERVHVISIADARRRPPRWTGMMGLIAASVALIALSSAVTLVLVRGAGTDPGAFATAGAGSTTAADGVALVAWEPVEREIVSTVEELQLALSLQRERLAPETVAVLERNLAIIDRAIGEARAALEADPANQDLSFLLMNVYQSKVELLQSAVQISNL